MTRIHEDHNGVYVNAISALSDGTNVEGHVYQIQAGDHACELRFQNGPVAEAGINGITNEALLAVLTHRLQYFQRGPFACRENANALANIGEAARWMASRTKNRLTRGVEGTNTP